MKRILPLILLCVLTLLLVGLFACTDTRVDPSPTPKDIVTPSPEEPAPTSDPTSDLEPAEEKKLILYLGDSIGEGLAGPSPLTERENYAFYGVVGNINNYEFYDRAVTGYTSRDLASFVAREDDGINRVESLISTADIIHISILGNDFLNSNHGQMMINLADENYEMITSRQVAAKGYLEEIFARLRELNPDAVVITQTLYNPVGDDWSLISARTATRLSERGVEPEDYHALMDHMIRAINEILYDYLEEHTTVNEDGSETTPFELVDVYSAFEEAYELDYTRWHSYFCDDGIHTRSEGHALIAECLQAKLTELGLAAENATQRYKEIRLSQLDRLYSSLEEREAVRSAIEDAESFRAVTQAYFDGTKSAVAHYVTQPTREGEHFSETKTFALTYLQIGDMELMQYIDTKNASITFFDDGSYTLYIPINEALVAILNTVLESGGINIGDYAYLGYAPLYFADIAPGAAKDDLMGVIRALKEWYLLEIDGLNLESEALQAICDRYRESGEIILQGEGLIGRTLALKSTGTYLLEKVTGLEGKEYTAIYVNNQVGTGESFVRYTYSEDTFFEDVRMTIDVVRIELEGTIEKDWE